MVAYFTFEAREAGERRASGMISNGTVGMDLDKAAGNFKIQFKGHVLIWQVKVLRRKKAKGQGEDGVEKKKKSSRGSVE